MREKVLKLLRLAARTPFANEAAIANRKADEILARLGIDRSAIALEETRFVGATGNATAAGGTTVIFGMNTQAFFRAAGLNANGVTAAESAAIRAFFSREAIDARMRRQRGELP